MITTNDMLAVLESFESAPSAHILVKSFVTAVSEEEIDEIYSASEGFNDQQTESILSEMDKSQMTELVEHFRQIAEELREAMEPEDFEESYGEATRLLENF